MEYINDVIEDFYYYKAIIYAKHKKHENNEYKQDIRTEAINTLNKILSYTFENAGGSLPKLEYTTKCKIAKYDNIKDRPVVYFDQVLHILKYYYNNLGIIKKLSDIYQEIPHSYCGLY